MPNNKRQSNIELLRIASILFILLMHGIGCACHTSDVLNHFGYTLINAFGNMGVTVFVVISGYFGVHFKVSKAVTLWLIMLFYSLLHYANELISCPYGFDWGDFFSALTPVSSSTWWFMTCYFVLLCFSPFLNKIVTSLSRKQMNCLMAVFILFFILFPTVLQHQITHDGGKGLPNFLLSYLVGQYIRRYDVPNSVRSHSGSLFLCCGVIVFLVDFIYRLLSPKAPSFFCCDNNLFIFCGAVGLFVWVRNHTFSSSRINYFAGYAFPLYLQNMLLLPYATPFYENESDSPVLWLYFFPAMACVVIAAVAVEYLRRWLLDRRINTLACAIDKIVTINF